MPTSIKPGNRRLLRATFTDYVSEEVVDPDEVHLVIRDPDGVETAYQYLIDSEILKISTGIYTAVIAFPTSGIWSYRWYSTGEGMASSEAFISVEYTKING